MTVRIGQGFDAHRLVDGPPLVLGGVRVPSDKGLAGHSDADVLVHAVCDACLGAAGLGDLGRHFPDTDPVYRDIDSRRLLRRVRELLTRDRWRIVNVDATIVAQQPRLAPYIESMQMHLAEDLDVEASWVNVKATTTEGLGFTGRVEGIAAYAVVLIERR